ncbi:MAG TPA: efflux RND transporter periplasmic adaptor subunit [Vicinamibacterales bacterium]
MTGRFAVALLLAGACATAACGSHAADNSETAAARPATGGDAEPAPVRLEQGQLSSLKVEAVAERDWPQAMTVAGKVQFDEDHVGRVLAPLSGPVAGMQVKVGDTVQRGQPLCEIESRDAAQAIDDHNESHKDLELAEKTAAMTEDLFEHQAASNIALQQSRNELAKSRARVTRSDAALRALGLTSEEQIARFDGRVPVVAPLSGTVTERKIIDGQIATTDGTPMITIADLSAVWVLGDIFERDLHKVAVGEGAAITTAAYPDETFNGRVDFISPVIDPATRTAKIRVSVRNPRQRLKPEMFANITLDGGTSERAVAVPSSAAFTEGGRTWVFVAVGDRQFVRRAVEIGSDPGADRRVLSGLRTGDRVVTGGVLLLRQEEKGAD